MCPWHPPPQTHTHTLATATQPLAHLVMCSHGPEACGCPQTHHHVCHLLLLKLCDSVGCTHWHRQHHMCRPTCPERLTGRTCRHTSGQPIINHDHGLACDVVMVMTVQCVCGERQRRRQNRSRHRHTGSTGQTGILMVCAGATPECPACTQGCNSC